MAVMPKDIMEAAMRVVRCHWATDTGYSTAMRNEIARELWRERKRCAEVAEERAEWVPLHAGDMRAAILGDAQ